MWSWSFADHWTRGRSRKTSIAATASEPTAMKLHSDTEALKFIVRLAQTSSCANVADRSRILPGKAGVDHPRLEVAEDPAQEVQRMLAPRRGRAAGNSRYQCGSRRRWFREWNP